MSRSLRPRKSRPQYNLLAGGVDDEAGPSRISDADSGSDFTPELPPAQSQHESDHAQALDDSDIDIDPPKPQNVVLSTTTTKSTRRVKKSTATPKPTGKGSAGGLPGASRRHMYVLPVPALHHRHRPPPLYYVQLQTLRLTKSPELFKPVSLTPTNSFLYSQGIARKLGKAWGHSVGAGPVWELLEDRAWYKEGDQGNPLEGHRRPKVYPALTVKQGWEVLDPERGSVYLPADTSVSDDDLFKPPPPVPCFLGKFGQQTRLELNMFDSIRMGPVYVHLPEPLIRIELADSCCWCFDWANSDLVAIGTTDGSIAVYDLSQTLNNAQSESSAPVTDILPTHFISTHQSAIRAITWIRAPPCSSTGEIVTDANPTVIASGGYDGSQCLTDIRDVTGYTINRTRDVITTMTYSPYCPGPVSIDHENVVKAFAISPAMLGRGHSLMDPEGPPWNVNASDYHPFIALGSADGTCSTTNSLRPPRRGTVPYFVHPLYQLDYNRATGEYRMLDCLLPREMRLVPSNDIKGSKGKQAEAKPIGTDAWPKEVGVHRAVWNNGNGFQGARMLASATASGLCRIDIPGGHWHKGKTPYQSIPLARAEDGDVDMDEDELSE
ncbi:hypothetical protein ONZ45_g5601 [Pleurotus djamor]|nr:hypothetical protein ONZ45_g5601 [Pleurotus djamor]